MERWVGLTDGQTEREQGRSTSPSGNIDTGRNPVPDKRPGTPCSSTRREGDGISVQLSITRSVAARLRGR